MSELEAILADTHPRRVMFTTFTNAGAKELADRAILKFPRFTDDDFRFFRTMHSIAYRNIPHQPMLNRRDYHGFGKVCGYMITGNKAISARDGNANKAAGLGDTLIHLDSLQRTKNISFEEVAALQDTTHLTAGAIADFSSAYRKYREEIGKYDFTDMLEGFRDSLDQRVLGIDHLLVDEAQDLSGLQWQIVNKLRAQVKTTIIAGDDKQAIYKFSGGMPEKLIHMEGQRKILGTSYRLPSAVLEYATTIADRLSEKQDYTVKANSVGGEVRTLRSLDTLDLSKGSWFFLVRNRSFMAAFETALLRKGVMFSSDSADTVMQGELLDCIALWKDLIKGFPISARDAKRLYCVLPSGAAVKRGGKKALTAHPDDESVDRVQLRDEFGLVTFGEWHSVFSIPERSRLFLKDLEEKGELDGKCRIRISTIHAVKGAEADNVVILPDMAYQTHNGMRKDPDSEHRVFYVAATRAKKNLYLHAPVTDRFYKLL